MIKRLLIPLFATRVAQKKQRLKVVLDNILMCLENMSYYRHHIEDNDENETVEDYQFTEYSKLKKEERKLTKFIKRWS